VGLPRDDVEATLKGLLESHEGHLAVSESGELIYSFDQKLIERDRISAMRRASQATKKLLRGAFKAWIVVMLVVYFVVFVALVIAAIAAMMSRGGDRRGGRSLGRGRGGGVRLPNLWLMYYLWTPRWRLGRPYYGRRWEATLDKDERPPFYKKVFAFVFGPDKPQPTRKQLDRSTLRLIRARKGVLTTAELVEHTALPLVEAESEMGRLLGSYGGEPAVSPGGELVYGFPELMVSAHGPVTTREPNPAWLRLERPMELTGNEKKHDMVIVGINGFNLLAAVTAPWFIFPQLGLSGTAAIVGLIVVPVVFSFLFFSIPGLRMLGVKKANRARHARNVRRLALGLVYERALTGGGPVTVDEVATHVTARLENRTERSVVESVVHELAAEFDANVTPLADGTLAFSFPQIRSRFLASEVMRRKLKLQDQPLGKVIYSSADSPEETTKRDLAAFDRALEGGEPDFSRYLPSPHRSGFEDEYEVVAFEEELARKNPRGATGQTRGRNGRGARS